MSQNNQSLSCVGQIILDELIQLNQINLNQI